MSTHQQLLQEVLVATGNVETCCLIRKLTSSVKATSIGFEVGRMRRYIIYTLCSLVKD